MENTIADITRLQKEFRSCQKVLTAIGDETRMHILFMMLDGPCSGQRVVDIASRTNLSRPAKRAPVFIIIWSRSQTRLPSSLVYFRISKEL